MKITFIRFHLTLQTEGAVTTPAPLSRGEIDTAVDLAPDGRPQLPGTSIAGIVQQRMFQIGTSQNDLDAMFGTVDKARGIAASPLWVFDAVATTGVDPIIRRTTAIDRDRGAARNKTLRTVQTLPAHTSFEVMMRWDGDQAGCDRLITALSGWVPRVGARVSCDQGRCVVSDLFTGTLDLSVKKDLLTWLTLSGPDLVTTVATTPHELPETSTGQDTVRLTWEVTAPLLVADPATSNAAPAGEHTKNTIAMMHRDHVPLIPASSIKGAVRSRMEFILRSVGIPVCGAGSDTAPCGRCLPCQFFGYGGNEDDDATSVGMRGRAIPREATVRCGSTRVRWHGAIDRFTGGNAQRTQADGGSVGLLYGIEATEEGTFVMEWDIGALQGDLIVHAFTNLLRLVADDFTDGLIGLGHATHSGYGSITLITAEQLPDRATAVDWLKEQVANNAPQGL